MEIRVLYFATLRDMVGEQEERVEVPEGATVADLVAEIVGAYPRFREMEPSLMISVNQEYSERGTALKEGDEVAFIPPISGGK